MLLKRKDKVVLLYLKNLLKDYLKKNFIDVVLFGSQTTGAQSKYSDYDVLILTKKKMDWINKNNIIDICYDVDLVYDVLLDPHILSEEELTSVRGKQPIFTNALKFGLRV